MRHVVTKDNARSRKVLLNNDVSRGLFEAPMQRNLCIELPDENKSEEEKRRDMVGHLKQGLYRTRDAAASSQKELMKFMERIGFRTSLYNPCTHLHR